MARIGILGSYGGLNVGDEAILTSMVTSLRAASPSSEIVVLSRDAEHTRMHHDVDHVVDTRDGRSDDVAAQVASLDLLVLGGGGLLYDGEARIYMRDVRLAQEQGVPTMAYAVGAGPLTDREDRTAVRKVVSAMTYVSVRDDGSKHVLEEAGVRAPVDLAADPALLLAPEPFPAELLAAEGVPVGTRLIGLSVREPGAAANFLDSENYHSVLAAAADFMVHRYGVHLLFIPMERQDVRHSHAVLAKMSTADRSRVLNGCYTPGQILGLVSHLDFLVGMRLHLLLFAGLAGVPFLPLGYASKIVELARLAGVQSVKGASPDCLGALLATLDEAWDTRQQRGGEAATRLARHRGKARRPLEAMLEILGSRLPAHGRPQEVRNLSATKNSRRLEGSRLVVGEERDAE